MLFQIAVVQLRSFLLFLPFLFAGGLWAQLSNVNERGTYEGYQAEHAIYHWTTSNGLPQSHISGITESKNRLIWISTYNGVVSFDGRRFMYTDPAAASPGISPFVTAIHAFGDTIVWASPQEIVWYYDNRILKVVPVKDPNIFIMRIDTYRGKPYFFAHDRVYYFDGRQLRALISIPSEKKLEGYGILTGIFTGSRLVCLMRHPSGKTLLYVYDYATGERKTIPTGEQLDNLTLRGGVPIAQAGTQWIALNDRLQPEGTVHRSPFPKTERIMQAGFEGDAFFYYTKTNLAIDYPGSQPAILTTSHTLYGEGLFASFRDHAGNLWLGTNSLGLFMFRKYPFRLFNFYQDEPVTNSSHAFVDDEGLLWFDNDCKLTTAFDLQTGSIRHQIADVCNWTDAQWTNDSIALFAYGTQHHWYDKRTKRLTVMKDISTPLTNFLRISPRHFILAGEGALYNWYGGKLYPWKKFRSKKTTCNHLLRAGPGDYYFATSEGLYHSLNGSWERITCGVESPDFRSLLLLKDHRYLLIGTNQSGILRYHLQTGKTDKLADIPPQILSCWSMIEDQFGQLWITSNNGIVQLFLHELMDCFDGRRHFLALNHYRHDNGIDNVEFNSRTQNKGTLLADGSIIFSSLGGPVIVHPQSNRQINMALGNLLVEKVTINRRSYTSGIRQLRLKEGDFVQLQFTLPSFSGERVLAFEYHVKGYRADWAPTSNHQLTLDNLPAGSYVLEIRTTCRNRILKIPVTVEKRHPNAWILYVSLLLAGALLIVFVTVFFTKRVQQKKHALLDLKQQLRLLEVEALRSQMNPHFIFNCLNTIQFLFISGNMARANKYLANFSALMRMTLDLLREPITTLDLELRATHLYVELEQLQFDDGFEFRLINHLQTPVSKIRVPSLFFQIFVENAILHGLRKTTESRPILTLIMEETDTEFIFHVGDNGPGISTQKRQDREDHTSVGIQLLKDRFALKSEIYNWPMSFYMRGNETIRDDIKTEIIITFGKVLLESSENEHPDRR